MATKKTDTLIKSLRGHMANVGNTTGRKRSAELTALGGLIYANRRKVLRALAAYEGLGLSLTIVRDKPKDDPYNAPLSLTALAAAPPPRGYGGEG